MRKNENRTFNNVDPLVSFVGCSDESMDKMSLIKSDIGLEKVRGNAKNDCIKAINVVPESIDHKGGLEKTDLADEWLFGLTITNTNDFFGKVLTAHSKAKVVRMISHKGRLYIYDLLERKVVMSLKMEKKGRVELIDFASALHNREVKEALKVNTMRQTGVSTYESYGRSKVLGTTIEEDMVIIDLRYPMVGVTQEGENLLKKKGVSI